MSFTTLPTMINGCEVSIDAFEFLTAPIISPAGDCLGWDVQEWLAVLQSKANPTGLSKSARPMYFVHRYFLEENNGSWGPMVYVSEFLSFFQIRGGIWTKMNDGMIMAHLSRKIIEYFGETSPTFESSCFKQLKSFYPVEGIHQNRNVVPFADCCISRKDLMKKKITILPLNPADQIIEFIPHNLRTTFESLSIAEEDFTLDKLLQKLALHPFIQMIDHFMPVDLQHMILGMIGDLIDAGKPHEWVFFFQSQVGGTGKGTILRILQEIVGMKNSITVNETLMKSQFAHSFIMNKKLYNVPETSKKFFDGVMLPDIKSISGGDSQTANMKHVVEPLSFIPYGLFFISTNDTPKLPPSEYALFRRFVIISMPTATPIPHTEYNQLKMDISNDIASLIAISTLLIPFKNQLHDRYKAKYDNKEVYERIGETPEWDFFDQCIENDASNEIEIHSSEIHTVFKTYLKFIERENYHTDLSGFTKMLTSHLKKIEKIHKKSFKKRRGMLNKKNSYFFKWINLNVMETAMIESEIVKREKDLEDSIF